MAADAHRTGRRRFGLRQPWLGLAAGAAGTLAAAAAVGLYGASQVVRPNRSPFRDDPATWGLPVEPLRFSSPDGFELSAWLARSPTARASVLLLPGYGASKHFTLPVMAMLFPRFHVLGLDFRGHGESSGSLTSVGYLERQDVIAATAEVKRRLDGPIGVLGESMGASAAILAAAECPDIAAVGADSSFATLRGAVARAAVRRGYPAPITPLLAELTCRTIALRQGYPVSAPDPLRVIGRIAPRPVLIMHGDADTLCPPDHAARLFAAAGEPKELWIAPGVAHAALYEQVADEFRARINAFFGRWLEIGAA